MTAVQVETTKSVSESSTSAAMEKPSFESLPSSASCVVQGDFQRKDVIEPTSVRGMTACPCCNRRLNQGTRQTLGETVLPPLYDSLLKDDSYSDDESADDMDEQDRMMPGILAEGESYHIKKVLVQGWVHKKGTGNDWMCSRAWKARWASLALARIAGYDADVPLLMISWHMAAPTPSTVLILDSTVIMPEDDNDKSKWNCYGFKIRHVKETEGSSPVQVTRRFSCPREGRDAWVFAINRALLDYEKEKAKARKAANAALTPSPASFSMLWNSDTLPSMLKSRHDNVPTTSPRSSPVKRNPMPRPNNGTLIEKIC